MLEILETNTCITHIIDENILQKEYIDRIEGETNPVSELSLNNRAMENI